MGFLSNNHSAPLTSASVLLFVIAAVAACGGPGTAATVTTQPTTTDPTLSPGPVGIAEHAPYWEWKITKQDPDLKRFGDYYAKEFCDKPMQLYVTNVDSQLLPHEYAFYRNKIGKPIDGMPTWKDDVETKSLLGAYMVSTYCPVEN